MNTKPLILGAIACAISTGVVAGATMPTTPLVDRGDPLAAIPDHAATTLSAEEARKRIAPQDRYPLETPDGVVPVAELAFHGRLRSRMREQPLYGASSEAEAFAMEARYERQAAPQARVLDANQPRLQPLQQANPQASQPANFVPLEDGIFENTADTALDQPARSEPQSSGQARVIRVDQELAERG